MAALKRNPGTLAAAGTSEIVEAWPDDADPPPVEDWPSAEVETFDDGTWQPAAQGAGLLCKLLPVRDADDAIFDIVAWPFGDPTCWWLRRGLATHLGANMIRRACWAGEAVRLVETPEAWLQGAVGHAVCILDWTADLRRIFADVAAVICDTSALAERLRETLAEQVAPRFAISIRRQP